MTLPTSLPVPLPVYSKCPAKGPKAIPLTLDFTISTSFELDFLGLELQTAFEGVQTVYVDNSLNAQQLSIFCENSNQNIVLPANSCAYVTVVQPGPAKMIISTTGALKITLHLLNYEISQSIWPVVSTGGGGGGNVTIVGPLGQKLMVASVSVVIASDQTPIPVTGPLTLAQLIAAEPLSTNDTIVGPLGVRPMVQSVSVVINNDATAPVIISGTVSITSGALIAEATATGLPPVAAENTTVNLSEDLYGNLRVVPFDLDKYSRRMIETQIVETIDLDVIGQMRRPNERFTPVDRRGQTSRGNVR